MKYFFALVLSLLSLLSGAKAPGQTAYTMQDLGTLGGPDVRVTGLNNKGDVVAQLFDNVATARTALYSNGVLKDITAQVGNAGGINDSGQIATTTGVYNATGFTGQAALYNIHTGQTQIIGPANAPASIAFAVNQNGVAIGQVAIQNKPFQSYYAALYRNGQTIPNSLPRSTTTTK